MLSLALEFIDDELAMDDFIEMLEEQAELENGPTDSDEDEE